MAKLLLISGSLRGGSTNSATMRTAAALAPDGVEATIYDGMGRLPHFNPDDDPADGVGLDPEVTTLRAALAEADALLLSTPEYAGALPGSFKNLLDWTVGGGQTYEMPVAGINVMPRLTRRDLPQFAPETQTCLGKLERMGQRPAGQGARGVEQIGRTKIAHDVLAVDVVNGTLDRVLAVGSLGAGLGLGRGALGLSCHFASPLSGNGARQE